MGKLTQGDYRFKHKIAGSKKRIQKLFTSEESKLLEKYEIAMVKSSLVDATKAKNYDMILALTRLLDGKNWTQLNQDDIDSLVVAIMDKHGDAGKETNTTSDHKRFLKIWFRFVKKGSRSFKKVGDPIETRDIESKTVESKVTREQLISPEENKKLIDACTNFRDKALIHTHYDAGTRIGEILSVQIKHIKIDKNGMTISVAGKTGSRNIRILEAVPTLATWLEMHPEKDNPEAYLFCSMKSIWTGNKLSYQGSVRVLRDACKRAKIRHIYWHLFRHTEATRTAKYMSDGITKKRHGWSATSKMPARYSHIVSQDVDDCFLKHHGIEPDNSEETSILPIVCPICREHNAHDSTICQRCGKPLTMDKAILLESETQQRNEKLENRIDKLEMLLANQFQEHLKNPEARKALKDVLKKDNSCFTAG